MSARSHYRSNYSWWKMLPPPISPEIPGRAPWKSQVAAHLCVVCCRCRLLCRQPAPKTTGRHKSDTKFLIPAGGVVVLPWIIIPHGKGRGRWFSSLFCGRCDTWWPSLLRLRARWFWMFPILAEADRDKRVRAGGIDIIRRIFWGEWEQKGFA